MLVDIGCDFIGSLILITDISKSADILAYPISVNRYSIPAVDPPPTGVTSKANSEIKSRSTASA